MTYELRVNGKRYQVEADADMPLVWVLRDLLGLTGTKFGCGMNLCRSCTVLVDGHETASCQMPVGRVGSAEITTIEGLTGMRAPGQSPDATLHAVQQAWLDEDVAQCGYCQPGQIMTAYALLSRKPDPSDQEIEAAMSDHICRCGTYNRIRRAVRRAADATRAGGAE